MSRRKTITISIILLVVCYVLYTRPERVQRGKSIYSVMARIDAGSGRSITILLDDTFLEIPGWYFEINEGPQIIVPITHLSRCCSPEVSPNLKLLSSRDHTIIGLVWDRRPDVLLVVHDFSSGESWPRGLDTDSIEANIQRGRKLRDRLQEDNPTPKLSLSHEVP
jgi:hypothetical protein